MQRLGLLPGLVPGSVGLRLGRAGAAAVVAAIHDALMLRRDVARASWPSGSLRLQAWRPGGQEAVQSAVTKKRTNSTYNTYGRSAHMQMRVDANEEEDGAEQMENAIQSFQHRWGRHRRMAAGVALRSAQCATRDNGRPTQRLMTIVVLAVLQRPQLPTMMLVRMLLTIVLQLRGRDDGQHASACAAEAAAAAATQPCASRRRAERGCTTR